MTSSGCDAGDVISDLEIDLSGSWPSGITVSLHLDDGTPDSVGDLIWQQNNQHGAERHYNVLKNTYDVRLTMGGEEYIWDAVDCHGETCTLDSSTLTVEFPGISSVHTYVYPSNGVAGTVSGSPAASRAYKTDQAVFAGLANGLYDVKVVKGAEVKIIDNVVALGGNAVVDDIVATLTVNFPDISSVHTYVSVDDGTSDSASGGSVDGSTYKTDSTTIAVLRDTYDVKVVKGSEAKIVDAVDCTGTTCTVDDIVATLTVNFPGISSVHTYVSVDDGTSDSASGGSVDGSTYKTDFTTIAVLRDTYDVKVVKGSEAKIVDAVDCTGTTCTVDDIVATLTVNFPGISSVHTYVSVDDGTSDSASGGSVDGSTYKTDFTTIAVLRDTYDVKVVKGSEAKIVDAVDCTGTTCTVDHIVAVFTLSFPGKSGVHVYAQVDDGIAGSATGGSVDSRTYQSNSTTMNLLKAFYDVVVKIGPDTYILDHVDCTSDTCVYSLAVVELLDSGGSGLAGGVAEYYSSGWHTIGTTPAGGVLALALPGGPTSYPFRMSYAGASQQKSQNIALDPVVVFQTASVSFALHDSGGGDLASDNAQYYASGWHTFGSGTTATTMELLPVSYPFRVFYGGASQQKSQNVGSDPNVVFTTVEVSFALHDSGGGDLASDNAQYYASGWHTFGSGTTATTMELLPVSYPFRVFYGGASQQKSQNVGSDPNVVFTTVEVSFALHDSGGGDLASDNAQYYASGWHTFGSGTTATTMELLPVSYPFRVFYGGASQQKSQNVGSDPNVVFTTVEVSFALHDSGGGDLASDNAQYYASGWHTFGSGTTATTMELLPVSYPFRVFYGGASQQKSQNVGSDPNVVFETGIVHSDSGTAIQYYASGWHTFTQDMELLPGSYPFRFSDGQPQTSYSIGAGVTTHIH